MIEVDIPGVGKRYRLARADGSNDPLPPELAKLEGKSLEELLAQYNREAVRGNVAPATGVPKPPVLNPFELAPTQKINKFEVEKLKKSIREKGFLHDPENPVAYVKFGDQKYIVDGHHRVRAAKELRLTEIPAVEVQLPYKGYRHRDDLFKFNR